MDINRKIVFVLAGFLLAILAIPLVFAAGVIFKDVEPDSWYEKAVYSLQQKEIIQGYPDQTFRPTNNVRRSELAVVIEKALRYIQNPEGIAPWKIYKNEKFFYEIAYPSKWQAKDFFDYLAGFQPPWMTDNNVQWAVTVLQNIDDVLQQEINKMGAEFPTTRSVLQQNVDLNGNQALVVTVATSEDPTFFHKQIFILRGNAYYIMNNGAILNSDFDLFWQSFKLLPLPPPEPEGVDTDSADSSGALTPFLKIGNTDISFASPTRQ